MSDTGNIPEFLIFDEGLMVGMRSIAERLREMRPEGRRRAEYDNDNAKLGDGLIARFELLEVEFDRPHIEGYLMALNDLRTLALMAHESGSPYAKQLTAAMSSLNTGLWRAADRKRVL